MKHFRQLGVKGVDLLDARDASKLEVFEITNALHKKRLQDCIKDLIRMQEKYDKKTKADEVASQNAAVTAAVPATRPLDIRTWQAAHVESWLCEVFEGAADLTT